MENTDPTRPQVPNPEIAPTPGRQPEIHPAESPQIHPARSKPEISREGEGLEIWPDSSPDATPQTPPEVRPITGLRQGKREPSSEGVPGTSQEIGAGK